jgi:plasmid stabilization system protein ParE
MIVRFLASARAEIAEAMKYYNREEPGLGDELVEEVHDTIQRILEHPNAWTALSSRTRKCQTRRFPYGIVYQIRENTLLIVSVMHTSRSPNSWKSRLPRDLR